VHADGRSKKAIADAAGVHASALSRWLAGSTPDYPNLERLARALHTSVNALLFGGEAREALREEPAAYYAHGPPGGGAFHGIPLADALAQLRDDLNAIEGGTPAERRRVFLFMREAHLPMLARALHLDGH